MNASFYMAFDPRFGNSSQTLIRHDFKRACYRVVLSELSFEDVKEYSSKIPLVINGAEIRGRELYRLLWKKKALIPASWDVATDNILKAFLL